MALSSFSVPGGHGSTFTFTVSGGVASAIAANFAAELANLQGEGKLFIAAVPKTVQTNDIEVTKTNVAKAGAVGRIAVTFGRNAGVLNGTTLHVSFNIMKGDTPAMAAAAIAAAINAAIAKYNTDQMAKRPPGPTITGMATAVGNAINLQDGAHGGIMTFPRTVVNGAVGVSVGPVALVRTQGSKLAAMAALPPVPAGKIGFAIVEDTTPGATITIPTGYDFVLNESSVPVTLDATADPNLISAGTGATTFFGGAGNGEVGAAVGAGNHYFQALGTGGGNYAIGYSTGNNTVWATSGNDLIQPGSGNNLVGLGSGSDVVVATGTDTILTAGGNATVFAGSNDLLFGNTGSLLFVGGGAGTESTVVAGSGAATLFGGAGSGLFFAGSGSFLLADGGGGSDTVVGGAGAASVLAFDNSGGSITLFDSSTNVLIAGVGNETLNALGTSGTNALWAGGTGAAGGGADSLIGGSGANIFGFVAGSISAGGNDTIGNWTAKDTLALIGYTAAQISQTTVGGSAVLTLSDGTAITVAGVPRIPSSHIFHS